MAKQATPIQFPVFRKEDFSTDDGVAVVNQHMAQIATFLNALTGVAGPTTLPSGVDVQGATVTGLAAPSGPTDAISSGHASASYGAQAQQPQLDLGGQYTLKGLAYCYQQVQKIPTNGATTTSGSTANGDWFTVGGLTVQFALNVALGGGDFAVTYPKDFTVIGVPVTVAVYPSGSTGYLTVVTGTASLTGFTVHQNNITGMSANWIAVGY